MIQGIKMVKLKMFGNEEPDDVFIQHMKIFLKLPIKQLKKIISSVEIENYYEQSWHRRNELIKIIKIEKEELQSILNLIYFIGKRIIINRNLKSQTILADVIKMGYKQNEISNLKLLLNLIEKNEFRENFIISYKAQNSLKAIIPTLDGINFLIDYRLITKDKKEVSRIPVIILKWNAKKEDDTNEELTFQVSVDNFKNIIDSFEEISDEIKILGLYDRNRRNLKK